MNNYLRSFPPVVNRNNRIHFWIVAALFCICKTASREAVNWKLLLLKHVDHHKTCKVSTMHDTYFKIFWWKLDKLYEGKSWRLEKHRKKTAIFYFFKWSGTRKIGRLWMQHNRMGGKILYKKTRENFQKLIWWSLTSNKVYNIRGRRAALQFSLVCFIQHRSKEKWSF